MKNFRVIVNNNEYIVAIEEISETARNVDEQPATKPTPAPAQTAPKPTATTQPQPSQAPAGDGTIIAPIPGTVLNIMVTAGDRVTKGQPLLILEAMKMENEIMATCDGSVQEIKVSKGQSVNAGDTLAVLSS